MRPFRLALPVFAAALALSSAAAGQEELELREPIFAYQAERYYPEAAASRGASGVVLLRCAATAKGRLDGCKVAQEEPTGLDFGAAARKMAADKAITISPKVIGDMPIAEDEVDVPVRFLASWRFVTQNLNGLAASIPGPALVARELTLPRQPEPFAEQAGYARQVEPVFGRKAMLFFPEGAARKEVNGLALLECTVGEGGRLQDCQAAGERPLWFGFGYAAMRMAKAGAVTVAPDAARPGALIRVPVRFFSRTGDMHKDDNGVLFDFMREMPR